MEYILWAYQAQPHSVMGCSPYILVHGCDTQGLDDMELSEYLKNDREPTKFNEVVIKLRGVLKINCENRQEGRRERAMKIL